MYTVSYRRILAAAATTKAASNEIYTNRKDAEAAAIRLNSKPYSPFFFFVTKLA